MAIEINQSKIYTIKFVDEHGTQKFVDISAQGTGDARDQFTQAYPLARIVTVFRKS